MSSEQMIKCSTSTCALQSHKYWWVCTPSVCSEWTTYLGSFSSWMGNRSPFRLTSTRNFISGIAFGYPANSRGIGVRRGGLMIGVFEDVVITTLTFPEETLYTHPFKN